MNINNYPTKVKNLTYVLSSIGAPINDENLVVATLNGLGKTIVIFFSIVFRKTFFDFQDLKTLLINEQMIIVRISSNAGS
jgi:hypothetical protein